MTGLLSPLSPTSAAMLNRTPVTASFSDRLKSSVTPSFVADNIDSMADAPPSSPFQPNVPPSQDPNSIEATDMTPSKYHTAKQTRRSPTKGFDIHCDLELEEVEPAQRKVDDERFRVPEVLSRRASEVTITGLDLDISEVGPPPVQRMIEDDDFSDDLSMCDAPTVVSEDTCFSTFSAVPNTDMTMFANLGNRTSNNVLGEITPRGPSSRTPATNRRQSSNAAHFSAAIRQPSKQSDNDTTSLLLDFTQQFEGGPPSARPSPSKSSTAPNLLSYINNQRSPGKAKPVTPAKRASVMNLLDFDLPPQPTPRSLPTITARELESLKSSYLSEISSLRASLSGKEAEVESLKKAVGDAERRVGEALETVRDETNAREHAEQEKQEWEKKGKEIETVMKSLKEAFQDLEKEREELLQKFEDSNEKLRHATSAKDTAETRVLELAAKLANSSNSSESGSSAGEDAIESLVSQRVSLQLDERMDGLARELHAVYKKKHETKVATLKKTYEARSEKKTVELQQKLETLIKQNEELQAASKELAPSPDASTNTSAELSEQKAQVANLLRQIETLSQTQSELLQDLERERSEKGELVAAVDEMLALQADLTAAAVTGQTPARASSVISGIEDFRKSISRPPPPTTVTAALGGKSESRIGRFGAPAPSRLGYAGAASNKSRMMSNIERMGGKSAAE